MSPLRRHGHSGGQAARQGVQPPIWLSGAKEGGMIVGYCRSVKAGAGLDAQRRRLAAVGAEKFFCDRAGILGRKRELERAIASSQKGDVITVTSSYHLARSTRGVLALARRLGQKGVGLRILDTPVDTTTATGRLILGSVPAWSLGISPLASALRDFLGARRAD